MILHKLACVAAYLVCSPALSSELTDLRDTITEIQKSERLAAAAIQVSDEFEIRQQRDKLDTLARALSINNLSETYPECLSAALALKEIAFQFDQLQRYGSIFAADQIYLSEQREVFPVAMNKCERQIGLEAPKRPNLRQ